jgi:hypothetical protein
MKKVITKAFMIYVSSLVVGACSSCGDFLGIGGDGDGPSKYNITDYLLYSVTATRNGTDIYFDPGATQLVNGNAVLWNEFGIFIDTEKEYISEARSSSSLFTNAIACDPAPPTAIQQITTFEITSDSEFVTDTQTYAAGESLNEIFDLDDMPNSMVNDLISARHPDIILLTLDAQPSETQFHRFSIHIELDNGDMYDLTTVQVHINL